MIREWICWIEIVTKGFVLDLVLNVDVGCFVVVVVNGFRVFLFYFPVFESLLLL